MAEIYDVDGEEICAGLQGSAVCDEAIRAAKGIAADRDEPVVLDDDGESIMVHPDGSTEPHEWEPSSLDEEYENADSEDFWSDLL